MKKAFKIFIWMLIAAWFVVVMGFVYSELDEVICNQVDITLRDSIRNRFVTQSDVREFIESYDIGIQGYPLKEINIRDLEDKLERSPYVKNAEVFSDVSGRLSIDIFQREPLLRIISEGGNGIYIDHEGFLLPLSENYSALIMLASGNIPYPDELGKHASIEAFSTKEKSRYHHLVELYSFARYISAHPFWSNQIVQIYRNRIGEYELIPRVGAHQILFGSMDNYEIKLRNLEALYKQGLGRYGWNTYNKINLKYSNQVICTKR